MAAPGDHVHEFRFDLPNSAPYPGSDSCKCGIFRDYGPNHHPYRLVAVGGRLEKIDEDMVPILQALWDAGVETAHCCQGGCPLFPAQLDPSVMVDSAQYREWLAGIDFGRLRTGYLSFASRDEAIAMRIIEKHLEVVDIYGPCTLRYAGDDQATAVQFTPLRMCPPCDETTAEMRAEQAQLRAQQ